MNILLCPLSDPGYLYPAIAVGLELERRQDTVSVLARSSAAPVLGQAGLAFLSSAEYGGRWSFSVNRWYTEGLGQYRATLRAAREVAADVLVTSVLCHGALLAAETLDIPVVVLGLAAHLWHYEAGGEDEPWSVAPRGWRSRVALSSYRQARAQAGLPERKPRSAGNFPLNGNALLLRGDPVLEYPGAVLPERVYHVGPCFWEPRPDPETLDPVLAHIDRVGKPTVYVHLGRVFGGTSPWPRLNAAFADGPFQAVVEQGRSANPQPAPGADLLVVRKPWMRPLIDRAGLVLTSGTSAPVLGALLHGRPIGVSPSGSEQPLLADACVRAGVAFRIANDATAGASALLRSAWQDTGMRARAGELGRRLARAGGPARAADIIQSMAAGHPAGAPGVSAHPRRAGISS